MKAFKNENQKCPFCFYPNDGCTPVNDLESIEAPREGDFTICIQCAQVAVFDVDLQLRLPTRLERTVISDSKQMKKYIEAIRVVQREVN